MTSQEGSEIFGEKGYQLTSLMWLKWNLLLWNGWGQILFRILSISVQIEKKIVQFKVLLKWSLWLSISKWSQFNTHSKKRKPCFFSQQFCVRHFPVHQGTSIRGFWSFRNYIWMCIVGNEDKERFTRHIILKIKFNITWKT